MGEIAATLRYVQSLVEPVDEEFYGVYEGDDRERLSGRDEEDWPVLATALALGCAIWRKTWTSLEPALRSGPRIA